MAGFKVTLKKVNIDPSMLDDPARKANEVLAMQAMKDTEQFVPALTGSLSDRTRTDGATIIYPGPYARFLYGGKVMVDPATGSPWAKKAATKTLTDKNLVFNHGTHQDPQAHWFEASKALNLDKWLKIYKKAVLKLK